MNWSLSGVRGAVRSVRRPVGEVVGDARAQVREDLREDPYLVYLLLLAALLASAWIWHRLPNFATRDERWRVVDPIRPVGFFVREPSLESIREGVTYWRSLSGTFYLYGLVLLPVILFLLVTGRGSVLVDLATYSPRTLWNDWQSVPAWVWTATVLPARLVNVCFAVASVYVLYRLGTAVRNRATGRLAALLFSLTWGLIVLAHEAGEDVPTLFFFLCAVYFAVEYVESGSRRTFYLGCLCGGVAAGFKFSAGVSALVLGAAFFSRARRFESPLREALVRPRLLATGVAIGTAAIAASYPELFVGAPEAIVYRLGRGVGGKASSHSWVVAPGWWWILRGYLNGLGLPLALAAVGGLAGSLVWVHEDSRVGDATRLSLVALGTVLVVYSLWGYVRTHHLLITVPLLVLLVAIGFDRLQRRRRTLAVVLAVALVVSTGAYAVAGTLGYAAQPRDDADAWLSNRVSENQTVETYLKDPQESAVPHGADVQNPIDPRRLPNLRDRCPAYVVLHTHTGLAYAAPDSYNKRTGSLSDPVIGEYFRDLVAAEEYPYDVVATFGRHPRFLDEAEPRPTWRRLLRVGLRPRTIQYGDPQDLGTYQYTVVLARTGECRGVVV